MKIFVTGGCGFIGSNLVRHLILETDHEVLNMDKLTYAGNPRSLADLEGNPRYTFAKVDLCDAEAVQAVLQDFQPDAIMHLAAESHVDRSIDGPADFIQTNVVGTFNLLHSALHYWRGTGKHVSRASCPSGPESDQPDFRFLHVSTDEVYGSLSKDDPAFTESTPYDPHSPYSAAKAASDHLARAWGDTVSWYLENRDWWENILNGSYRLERLGMGKAEQA